MHAGAKHAGANLGQCLLAWPLHPHAPAHKFNNAVRQPDQIWPVANHHDGPPLGPQSPQAALKGRIGFSVKIGIGFVQHHQRRVAI